MLVPLPASQKKAQPPPSSLLFDSDDEDFEPSPVAGPQAALYNGAPSHRAMAEDHASPKVAEADNAEEAAVELRPTETLENHAEQVCRVCFGEADLENGPLFQPCACRGSIAFGHKLCIERCLREWGDMCTICRTCIKARRYGPPLWHFLRDFINWRDMLWIAANAFMVSGEVFLLVTVWAILIEYLGTRSWITDLLAIGGLLLSAFLWTFMEFIRYSICHEKYEAWRKRTVTVELIVPHSEAQNDPPESSAANRSCHWSPRIGIPLRSKRGAVLLHVRREPGQTEAQAAIVFLGLPSAVHSVIGLPKVQQTAVCRSGVWRCRECGCGGADIRQNGLSPGREVRDRRRRGSRETNGAEAVPVHYLGKTSRRASKGGERESGAENVVIATEGDPRITPG
ncbi:hypothetical protein MTO96_044013 [Rhipicephalus appendiculatus]